jgi:POT family proton-dependent oligopeptide transporter
MTQPTDPPSPEQKPGFMQMLQGLWRTSRGYLLVNWVNFGDGIAYFGFLALMTLFLRVNAGFSTQISSIAVSFFTGGVTIFMALGGGTVSDRLGARRALSVSLAVVLVGRVLFTLSPQAGGHGMVAALAAFAILVMAFGEGVIQPALYAGVKEYTAPGTATMGYAFLYSIMNLGIVAGELLSPLVREFWARHFEGLDVQQHPSAGIAGSFWLFTAFTGVLLLSNVLLFTRKVERRDRVVVPQPESKAAGGWAQRLRSLPILDGRFLFFIFVLLPVRTLFAHQWLTLPDYVTRAFPAEVGARWEWINGLNPLVIVIGVPVIAALTRRRHVIDMMIVGTLISAVSSFLLVTGPNLTLLLIYVVVFSLGEAAWSSRFLEYVADLAPANRVGIYMGVAGIPWFLAKMITGLYAGTMVEHFIPQQGVQHTSVLWLIHGSIAMLSPVGLIVARRWLLKREAAGRAATAA